MPSAIPAALVKVSARLRCPICRGPLAPVRGSLVCSHGHTYDVARPGYVNLGSPGRRITVGDDAGMVAARVSTQAARHFDPLSAALIAEVEQVAAGCATILDAGAGTGHHLARLLDALSGAQGVALDASRDASRQSARAHPRIAAVRCDLRDQIPLHSAAADIALCVFAPRNGPEFARILRPGGVLIVVTPTPGHLGELAMLHDVRVDPRKDERLRRELIPAFRLRRLSQLVWSVQVTRSEIRAILGMGPAGKHLRPRLEDRLVRLPEQIRVTAAVELRMFERPTQAVPTGTQATTASDDTRSPSFAGSAGGLAPRQVN